MMRDEPERLEGIENRTHNHRSTGNIYEYRDTPGIGGLKSKHYQSDPRRTSSTPSLRAGSTGSLKDTGVVSESPTGEPRKQRTPIASKRVTTTKPPLGVPQTDV